MITLRKMTPAEYSKANLIGTARSPGLGVEGNQALVQALGDKLREIADENTVSQIANNTEFFNGIAAAAVKADTYTKSQVDSKDAATLGAAIGHADSRIENVLQAAIYDVLYYDPLDGFKKRLQEILYSIASIQLPGYTCYALDLKDYTTQQWDDLDITCAEFDGGAF